MTQPDTSWAGIVDSIFATVTLRDYLLTKRKARGRHLRKLARQRKSAARRRSGSISGVAQ